VKKHLVILLHLFFSTFGFLEYCFSRGIKKLKFNLDYHYSSRINYQHSAYQDIMITITDSPQEAILTSHMLCTSMGNQIPLLITWKIPLN
jgi:hypothetical protein